MPPVEEEPKPDTLEEAREWKTRALKYEAGMLPLLLIGCSFRQVETGEAAPAEVLDYRAAVRAVYQYN